MCVYTKAVMTRLKTKDVLASGGGSRSLKVDC